MKTSLEVTTAHPAKRNREHARWILLAMLPVLMLLSKSLWAQGSNSGSEPAKVDTPSAESGSQPQQPTGLQTTEAAATDQTTDLVQPADTTQGNNTPQQPMVRSLETGLPLRSLTSPLRWGRLSLLSVSAFAAYDTDPELLGTHQGTSASQLGVLQSLLAYSIERARWNLEFQYFPYVWFNQQTTYTNFMANALDLHTGRNFGTRWRLNLADSFAYSPAVANSLGSGFNADSSTNIASSMPFLAAGHDFWINNANVAVVRTLSERSNLSILLNDSFISYSGGSSTHAEIPPGTQQQQQDAYGAGAVWSRQWSTRNTITLGYNYRRLTYPGSTQSTQFQTASLGYTRILKPNLTASLEIGPGWSSTSDGGQSPYRTTLQGSAGLFKAFANGGIALAFYRGNDFTGVISTSYNNRYNLAINRRFLRRLNAELSASYLQQQFLGRPTTTGEVGFAQLSYLLSRDWSFFGSYRYFNTANEGTSTLLRPQQVVAAGIRWAWDPERK